MVSCDLLGMYGRVQGGNGIEVHVVRPEHTLPDALVDKKSIYTLVKVVVSISKSVWC